MTVAVRMGEYRVGVAGQLAEQAGAVGGGGSARGAGGGSRGTVGAAGTTGGATDAGRAVGASRVDGGSAVAARGAGEASAPEAGAAEPAGKVRTVESAGEDWAIYGLGSCIGLILCDPRTRVSALAHIVLPEANGSLNGDDHPATRYADRAVPFLLELLLERGAAKSRIVAQMAGGARVLNLNGSMDIGRRNIEVVRRMLAAARIPVVAERVGGTQGQTLRWNPNTGQAWVTRVGTPEVLLTPEEYVFQEPRPVSRGRRGQSQIRNSIFGPHPSGK